jgi:hypothetical protein
MQLDEDMPNVPSTATTPNQQSASNISPSIDALMRSIDDIVAGPAPTGSMLQTQPTTPSPSHITRTYQAAPATPLSPVLTRSPATQETQHTPAGTSRGTPLRCSTSTSSNPRRSTQNSSPHNPIPSQPPHRMIAPVRGHYASALAAAIDNILEAPSTETRHQRVLKLKHISTQGLIDASFESGYTHRTHTRLQTFQQADPATFHPLRKAKPCP